VKLTAANFSAIERGFIVDHRTDFDHDDNERRYRDRGERTLLPPPSQPMAFARIFIRECLHNGIPTLRHWRGGWWMWKTTHWIEVEAGAVRSILYASPSMRCTMTLRNSRAVGAEQAQDRRSDRRADWDLYTRPSPRFRSVGRGIRPADSGSTSGSLSAIVEAPPHCLTSWTMRTQITDPRPLCPQLVHTVRGHLQCVPGVGRQS